MLGSSFFFSRCSLIRLFPDRLLHYHTVGLEGSINPSFLLDKIHDFLFEYGPFQRLALSVHEMAPSQDPLFAGLGQAVRVGTDLLAALIVGGFLGWLIDEYVLGTTPWGMVVGLILGLVAGIRNAYRAAQRWGS